MGHPRPRMTSVPPIRSTVATPPNSDRICTAISTFCRRLRAGAFDAFSEAIFRPTSRMAFLSSRRASRRLMARRTSSSNRPYDFGNTSSTAAVTAHTTCGFRVPPRVPAATTKPSRSRLMRCARTALSVSLSSDASSSTVRSRCRSKLRICPRVLSRSRFRHGEFFKLLKIRAPRTSQTSF